MKWGMGRMALTCALGAFAFPACQWSSDSSSGLTSVIRVENGQAKRGSIADPPDRIQATATLTPRERTIFPGETAKSIKGNVGPNANAVALGVAGDEVYWLVPALDPENENADFFTYVASLSLARDIARNPLLQPDSNGGASTLPLSYRAVDEAGNFGPTRIRV